MNGGKFYKPFRPYPKGIESIIKPVKIIIPKFSLSFSYCSLPYILFPIPWTRLVIGM
jgi:hypothetical protein